ncbi:hypothetical protein [Methylobacterium oryzisoli]|uniref:hypothetical protein n=1 Tax=Methylobacterium oryzisoli TaxID=3385502 RepID=UPI0038925D48
MKKLLTGTILIATVAMAVPASAQVIDFGRGGPSVDLRSRGERERDFRRDEMRRDRDVERRRYYREQRFRDEDRGYGRRDYRY